MTHGKSVVVPREPTEAMLVAADNAGGSFAGSDLSEHDMHQIIWAVMLAAAPAPSSLAGGEGSQNKHDYDALTCIAAHLRDNPAHPFSGRQCEEFVQSARDAQFAALPPEAPAREGVNDNPLTFGMGALVVNTGKFGGDNAVFIARAKEPGEVGAYTGKSSFDRKTLQPGELVMIFPTAEQAQVVADALVGALTPRHEAPAEGEGEVEAWLIEHPIRNRRVVDARTFDASSDEFWITPEVKAEYTLTPLRARSSAPEAREGEAVAWRSRQKPGRYGPMPWHYSEEPGISPEDPLYEVQPLYTHPAAPSADHAELTRLAEAAGEEALGNLLAVIHGDGGHRALEVGTKQAALEAEKIVAGLFAAPSADKLRIAVEALEPFAQAGRDLYPDDADTMRPAVVQAVHFRAAAKALAALKAEA